MPTRYELITELYREHSAFITKNAQNWMDFLKTACRNYRLPFEEQILLYAQCPDATAVLEVDAWNKRFGRWVNRNAKGIAVVDREYAGQQRLKYYFDISDTHESRYSRPVPIWQYDRRMDEGMIRELSSRYGDAVDTASVETALISATRVAVADSLEAYTADILDMRQGSLLEDLSDAEVKAMFYDLLINSVSYMALARCDMNTELYFEREDFTDIFHFNTVSSLTAYGVALRQAAGEYLSVIAVTLQQLQKAKTDTNRTVAQTADVAYADAVDKTADDERSETHDLHEPKRISDPEHSARAGAERAPWQIRVAPPSVSEGASGEPVHHADDDGQASRTPDGDRSSGTGTHSADRVADGTSQRRDGTAQGERSDQVDGDDEQHPTSGGGNGHERTDLQLSSTITDSDLPPLLDETIIMAIIANLDDDLIYKKDQIALFFSVHTEEAERAAYLKTAYQDRYTELIVDGKRVGYKPMQDGLLMWEGAYLSRTKESVFSWGCVADFTAQLIDRHEYTVNLSAKHLPPQDTQQLSLFDGIASVTESDASEPIFTPRKMAQQIVDEALCIGANDRESVLKIVAYFMKDKPLEDNAAFLKEHYKTNGAGFYYDGRRISLWYGEDGMHIAEGTSALQSYATHLSWEQAAKRIRELLDLGRYAPQDVLLRAPDFERESLAQTMMFTVRDISEEAAEQNFAPTVKLVLSSRKSFDEEKKDLAALLADPERLDKIVKEWQAFADAHAQNPDLMRFRFYRPKTVLARLQDLQREPVIFQTAEPNTAFERTYFISQDEIDKALRSEGSEEYRLSVYAFYSTHTDQKERETFLRKAHGDGGSYGGNDNKAYSSKGLLFSHGSILEPYAKVELSWSVIAKRIQQLITVDRFLTKADKERMPAYERKQLANKIRLAFHAATDDMPRPYQQTDLVKYWESVDEIAEQMTDPARVREIYETMLLPMKEATPPDHRHYAYLQNALEAMEQYLDGTFSVYGRDHTLEPLRFLEETAQRKEVIEEPPPVQDEVVETVSDDQDEQDEAVVDVLPPEKETDTALAPPKPQRDYVLFDKLHPDIPSYQRHDFHITDPELGYGTPSEKYAANVAAIRTLQTIEAEDRLATPEEQEILFRYVGWGGLADCFDDRSPHYLELKSLLDEDEYAAARASALTAFYTSPVIIGAMYDALQKMGFRNGNILEPSCGVGNFIGMLPQTMQDSHIYGVELDSISGRIARQLYQNSRIAVTGFEKVEMPDSFFDVAVGNVPFGDFGVADRRYDKHHFLIHDYFFGKTLDKVRPGGIVAFVTSKGTMDKENSAVRKYIAQRADLIGAIRLPNTAFKNNAGTVVTSDILFLQKRDHLTDIEPDWVHLDTDEHGIKMNSYFVQHPEMILGRMEMVSSRFGMDSTCQAIEGADLSEQLQTAIGYLDGHITDYEMEETQDDLSIPADPSVRNFSFTIVDGKLYFRENSRMHPAQVSATGEKRIRGLIELRECVRRLIELQTEGYPDEDIQKEQERLNTLYDRFVEKYGRISSRGNSMAFSDDSGYYLLCSLEVMDEEGEFKRKADMFTKRTIRPHEAVTSVDTASEALAVSISEKARVDMPYMAQLSGKTEDELETELAGVIYRDIHCAQTAAEIPQAHLDLTRYPFVTADEYLSGNVRRKLRMAKALRDALPDEQKGKLDGYVSALETVQPVDLTAGEIGVRIGVNWIPTKVYEDFMYDLLGTNYYARNRMKILYSGATGEWNITNKNADIANVRAFSTYGTKRISAYHILEQTLNQKDVRIYDKVVDEHGNEQRVLNKKETAIAQDRQELIKAKFAEWLWKDIDRRDMLCRIYNETFNSIRPREYDGQHIRFSGMNPEITLRPHQVNAIAHIMYGGNTLLAHEVGAGKTFEMVAAAMESKRLGLCTKSLIVVPNHITEQWAAEWLQLYPSANVLVATKKDFTTRNRKKFCARIATGDYDAIIIGHSQFEKIPMSKERQEVILQRQIDEIMAGISEAKSAKAERYTIKQLERTKKSLETRLEKLNDQSRKDDVVTFEQLGVDRIFVDESHYFKNLFLATKMRNVGGIAQTEAQKSSDLFMKCQYLDELTGGRGVVFATGTPISNSMVELYTIQRYLQYGMLQDMNMLHFDDWAASYGETVTAIELSPEGSGYRSKTRFAKFYNLPELMSNFKMVADIQTADMLHLPVPKANFHTEVITPSELQRDMITSLAERAERIRAGGVDPSVDNMLRITNDGRKLALDMRLVQPLAPDNENGKVAVCARNVFEIWDRTRENRSAQMVFCDLSTPKGDGSFNVYDDLKAKLMAKGIPEEEIAYIHDANTEAKKKELFAKVRSGQVRVLLGSTAKMGAGTNCQDRLIALHDLDCPWRPSDLAQRLGRIVRQGNQNPEVEIYRYVTENTFDAYLYQLVENKQKFIAQIMTSKAPVRVAADVDETALSYSEIKALATGNPLIIEKCNLDMEVAKLNMLKANHLNQRYALEDLVLKKYPEMIARLTERVAGYEKDIATALAHPKPPEGFVGMTIHSKEIIDKETAGKAIIDACTTITGSDAVPLGQYRGFAMFICYDRIANEYRIMLKGALSHPVVLGADIYGNITRLDNVIDGLQGKLELTRSELINTQTQLENARVEMETPFPKEAELAEKSKRLKELNILLNMDQKDSALLDDTPDEGDDTSTPKPRVQDR